VTNVQDKKFGLVANGLRYLVPVEFDHKPVLADHYDADPLYGIKWGDSPLGGAHTFLTSALFLLAEASPSSALKTRALHYGNILLGPGHKTSSAWRWEKWTYLIPPALLK
jgi:hypothetical protein